MTKSQNVTSNDAFSLSCRRSQNPGSCAPYIVYIHDDGNFLRSFFLVATSTGVTLSYIIFGRHLLLSVWILTWEKKWKVPWQQQDHEIFLSHTCNFFLFFIILNPLSYFASYIFISKNTLKRARHATDIVVSVIKKRRLAIIRKSSFRREILKVRSTWYP